MAEKYIPLSAAVDEMKSWEQENKCYHPEDYEDEEQEEPGIPVLEVIERLNSIEPADVRPVVLCRDCIHWKTYPSPTGDKKYCSVFDWINSSTGLDFCSFAERRGADMRPEGGADE